MQEFFNFYDLPNIGRTIDDIHIHIQKHYVSREDYFYFKSGGYTIQVQAVVDRHHRFLDLVVEMPRSTHDSRI